MRAQAFHLGEFPHGRERFPERSAAVFHHAGAPLELVNRQAGKRGARAAGGQGVVRAGHIIAQHRG